MGSPKPEDRRNENGAEEISLYLHIPFCKAKCDYCDFFSIPLWEHASLENARTDAIDRYIDTLVKETKRRFDEVRGESAKSAEPESAESKSVIVPTLYIGGGTPSILGADGIGRLLEGLAPLIGKGCREITVEANPESADEAFLRACADHGVTRLSLGIQSFYEPARQAAGRRGGLPLRRLEAASEIFGAGLSVDLMTGLPFQSAAVVRAGVDRAVSLQPGHVSLYSLTVEEGTPLAKRLAQAGPSKQAGLPGRTGLSGFAGRPVLPSAAEADRLWLAGRDALVRAGYEQYEVSNFALPGKRCAHNIRYWRMENWIGTGCAASGTIIEKPDGADIRGRRAGYVPDVEAFLASPASCLSVEELDRLTLLKESLLMGFRYIEGPHPELFERRFGIGIEKAVPRTLEKWRNPKGSLSRRGGELVQPGRPALTVHGLLFLNRFLLDCFEELDTQL